MIAEAWKCKHWKSRRSIKRWSLQKTTWRCSKKRKYTWRGICVSRQVCQEVGQRVLLKNFHLRHKYIAKLRCSIHIPIYVSERIYSDCNSGSIRIQAKVTGYFGVSSPKCRPPHDRYNYSSRHGLHVSKAQELWPLKILYGLSDSGTIVMQLLHVSSKIRKWYQLQMSLNILRSYCEQL